jgi:hypothetical protein
MLMLGMVQKVTFRLLLVWDTGLYSKRGLLVRCSILSQHEWPHDQDSEIKVIRVAATSYTAVYIE